MGGRSRAAPVWSLIASDVAPMDSGQAEIVLSLLRRWATRRAQRIAKERSGIAGGARKSRKNRRLQPEESGERT